MLVSAHSSYSNTPGKRIYPKKSKSKKNVRDSVTMQECFNSNNRKFKGCEEWSLTSIRGGSFTAEEEDAEAVKKRLELYELRSGEQVEPLGVREGLKKVVGFDLSFYILHWIFFLLEGSELTMNSMKGLFEIEPLLLSSKG